MISRVRLRHAVALVALATIGCAPAAGGVAAPPRQSNSASGAGADLVVDSTLAQGPPAVLAAWLAYGAARADAPNVNAYRTEVRARSLLADTWKKRRGDTPRDAYLDLLVEVQSAGFLGEYVLAFLGSPGWTVPAEDLTKLNPSGFRQWMPGHLSKDHRAESRVDIRSTTAQAPVLGSTLPSPEELDPGKVPCPASRSKLSAALETWQKEEARAKEVAVAGVTSDQLLAAVAWAQLDERARRQGIVFASPKAMDTLFIAGFCAVERHDLAAAEAFLGRAVRLSPGAAGLRGELAQTLILEKKLDEADAQVDAALETADSTCQTAMLWRKRGYILFDRGRLIESYHAYAKSLEYDPGSELAAKEMQAIVEELRRTGGFDGKQLKPYMPPPAVTVVVTRCR